MKAIAMRATQEDWDSVKELQELADKLRYKIEKL